MMRGSSGFGRAPARSSGILFLEICCAPAGPDLPALSLKRLLQPNSIAVFGGESAIGVSPGGMSANAGVKGSIDGGALLAFTVLLDDEHVAQHLTRRGRELRRQPAKAPPMARRGVAVGGTEGQPVVRGAVLRVHGAQRFALEPLLARVLVHHRQANGLRQRTSGRGGSESVSETLKILWEFLSGE